MMLAFTSCSSSCTRPSACSLTPTPAPPTALLTLAVSKTPTTTCLTSCAMKLLTAAAPTQTS